MQKKIMLEDIVGLDKQKEQIHDFIFLPLIQKELYEKLVTSPEKLKIRKNFLLYGPPGTAKTSLVQALAQTYDVPFTLVQSTQFLNQYVGAGAETMRKIYSNYTGIIFIDEIDLIAQKQKNNSSQKSDDLLMQLLMLLDGVATNYEISTITATNKPELLDERFLSRIPQKNRLFFPLPDEEQRKKIFEKKLTYVSHNIENLDEILLLTKNYHGRQIEDLIVEACNIALKDERTQLISNDLYLALEGN